MAPQRRDLLLSELETEVFREAAFVALCGAIEVLGFDLIQLCEVTV